MTPTQLQDHTAPAAARLPGMMIADLLGAMFGERRPSAREFALAWAGLLVLAVLVFLPHIRHGALSFDDWANGAATLQPPGGRGVLSYFWHLTGYRPTLVLYVPLTFLVLGSNAAAQLAWAAALALLIAGLLYAVLRALSLPPGHAWLIAALTLPFPWYDATRMWASASQASVSIVFYLAGLWAALHGIERRSSRWHVVAAALYLVSVLTYEVALPVILASGLLYLIRAGWRVARWRWLGDIVAAVIGAAWVGTHEQHQSYGVSADLTHAGHMVTGGGSIIGRAVIALGITPRTTVALVALLVVLLVGVVMVVVTARPRAATPPPVPRGQVEHPAAAPVGMTARGWLLVTVGGLVAAALAWVMFVPADPYYTPTIYGITNRVNALAGLGVVILVYGACGLVGSIVSQIAGRRLIVASGVTVLLGVLIGATYVRVYERHARIWDLAGRYEQQEMSAITAKVPSPAPGTTMFVGGFPENETLGVPIFAATYDLNGAVRLRYHTPSVSAYAYLNGTQLSCGQQGMSFTGPGAATKTGRYGRTWLIDVAGQRAARPAGPRSCRRFARHFAPGTLYLAGTY